MTKEIITQSYLKSVFHYCPDSGMFTRKTVTCNSVKIGDVSKDVNNHGYVQICIKSVLMSAHQLAFLYMEGKFPPNQVDHIDHNRSNNSWKNLRKVTRDQNLQNQKFHSNNTSGVTGVSRHGNDRWLTEISFRGTAVYRKSHKSFHKAVAIRKALEVFYGYHKNHGNTPIID